METNKQKQTEDLTQTRLVLNIAFTFTKRKLDVILLYTYILTYVYHFDYSKSPAKTRLLAPVSFYLFICIHFTEFNSHFCF